MRRAARRVSKSTLNQTLAGVVSFFDWCVVTKDSEGRSMLQGDPPDIRRIRKISKLESPRSDPEYYLPADIEKLFASAGAESDSEIRWPVRDLAMCAFLAVLGLRASELTDLRVNSVTQERLSTSDKSATWMLQVLGKGKKWRSLPLSDELHRAVTQWEKARKVEIKSLRVKFRNLNLAEGVVDWLVDTKGFPTSVSVGAVRSALGEGDIPIAGVIGGLLGLHLGISAIFLATLLGLSLSIYNLLSKKEIETPFIPFLSLGLFITFITGFNIFSWFLY
jgi:prepilin signal peptidase PulO-like enzyme (type II secretory pathway)